MGSPDGTPLLRIPVSIPSPWDSHKQSQRFGHMTYPNLGCFGKPFPHTKDLPFTSPSFFDLLGWRPNHQFFSMTLGHQRGYTCNTDIVCNMISFTQGVYQSRVRTFVKQPPPVPRGIVLRQKPQFSRQRVCNYIMRVLSSVLA